MGASWGRIGGVLRNLLPFAATMFGGPVGSIVMAISTAVVAVENTVHNQPGTTKRQKALDLVGTLLVIGEDSAGKDLVSNPLVLDAAARVMDLEVTANNAIADLQAARDALAAVVEDIQAKRASS